MWGKRLVSSPRPGNRERQCKNNNRFLPQRISTHIQQLLFFAFALSPVCLVLPLLFHPRPPFTSKHLCSQWERGGMIMMMMSYAAKSQLIIPRPFARPSLLGPFANNNLSSPRARWPLQPPVLSSQLRLFLVLLACAHLAYFCQKKTLISVNNDIWVILIHPLTSQVWPLLPASSFLLWCLILFPRPLDGWSTIVHICLLDACILLKRYPKPRSI